MSFTYAQSQAEAPKPQAAKPSVIEQFMPFVFILAIIYFLFIRPSQKRMRLHSEFVKNLKKGDEVLTNGGLLGTIEGLTDKYITLDLGDRTLVRVLRSHVSAFSEDKNQQGAQKGIRP